MKTSMIDSAGSSLSGGPGEDAEERESSSLAGLITHVSDQGKSGLQHPKHPMLASAKHSRRAG